MKNAVASAFFEINGNWIDGLDIDTLRDHLIRRHSEHIFKDSAGEPQRTDESMSNASDHQFDKALIDKFNERLKKLLSRHDKLFSKGPKLYALPTNEMLMIPL